uniref:ABC transmembrane type-1 domain-containing protein n=1 Tax=Bursaphelenchus xylophilus TaxID=6326 RepID=A0A1I7SDL2_BURXY
MVLTTVLSMLRYVGTSDDRDFVDRINSFFTTNILIALSVLVSFKVGVKYLAQYFGFSFEKRLERNVEEQVLDSRLSCSIAENAMHEEEFSSFKFLGNKIRVRDVIYGIFIFRLGLVFANQWLCEGNDGLYTSILNKNFTINMFY